jgi:hypothetical protein
MKFAAYPITSRYYGVGTAETTTPDGRVVRYLLRRFVPPPERFAEVYRHTVLQGQRPDHLAHQHLGDPQQFWRICDANGVTDPHELTDTPGRAIRITLPEGVPGPGDA